MNLYMLNTLNNSLKNKKNQWLEGCQFRNSITSEFLDFLKIQFCYSTPPGSLVAGRRT
jgi:hypothetical protein